MAKTGRPQRTSSNSLHELRDATPEREAFDLGSCSCGSAIWLDVTTAVCIASDQILGRLDHLAPDPGVKIGRRY